MCIVDHMCLLACNVCGGITAVAFSCCGILHLTLFIFYKKVKTVSCEFNCLNGRNSTLQAAWYIRHVRRTRFFYISFIIWFLWTKHTIRLLILSFTKSIRACSTSMFYPYERYRSVTPLDAARVNRTIFHNPSVQRYYITLIKRREFIKHDIVMKTW